MNNKKSLLFWGELPPTVYHGISLSNERILSALSSDFEIFKVEDNTSFGGVVWSLFSFIISLSKIAYFICKKIDIYYLNLPMSYLGLWKVYLSVVFVKFFSSKTKIISHLHRGDFLVFVENASNKKLFKKFANNVDVILVLSDTAKQELINSGLIKEHKVEVLHNTVAVKTNRNKILQNVLDDFTQSSFYCLCNYIPTKRIHNLVEIANDIPLVSMAFNGAASSDNYMQRLSILNKASICTFNDVIDGDEKEEALAKSKALVLPSLNEGMPLVILESLAQGTPVICFDVGYISDYIGKDYPGLVTDLSDMALKEKVIWLNQLSDDDYLSLREISYKVFWVRFDPVIINLATSLIFKKL